MLGNIQVQTRKIDSLLTSIGNPKFYIYSGAMPSATNTFTVSNYSSSLLLTFGPLATGWLTRDSSSATGTRVFMKTYPANVNATLSGTASWFCLYESSSLFMLGDVSNASGTGVLVLTTTSIVSGTSYGIYSFAFELKQ